MSVSLPRNPLFPSLASASSQGITSCSDAAFFLCVSAAAKLSSLDFISLSVWSSSLISTQSFSFTSFGFSSIGVAAFFICASFTWTNLRNNVIKDSSSFFARGGGGSPEAVFFSGAMGIFDLVGSGFSLLISEDIQRSIRLDTIIMILFFGGSSFLGAGALGIKNVAFILSINLKKKFFCLFSNPFVSFNNRFCSFIFTFFMPARLNFVICSFGSSTLTLGTFCFSLRNSILMNMYFEIKKYLASNNNNRNLFLIETSNRKPGAWDSFSFFILILGFFGLNLCINAIRILVIQRENADSFFI